jgi:UDP-glucose 4-epimerase
LKALVTGGAGFIGSNLVQTLSEQGNEIVVLDNLSSCKPSNLDNIEARLIVGDVRDGDLVLNAAAGCSTIFHLAASVGNQRSIDNPVHDSDVNVIGTIRVLEAARIAGVQKVVFSSSAGIFGELKSLPIRENHPCEPDSPYGASKLCAEKQCLAYSRMYEMSCVCLRYFNVFGPRQRFDAYGNVIPIFVFRMLRGQPICIFGDGEQTRDFINVGDIVQANIKSSLRPDAAGPYNLGSGTRISINSLVELISELTGIIPEIIHGPPRVGDVRDSLADIAKARYEFDFHPSVPLRDGLIEYLEWAAYEVKCS